MNKISASKAWIALLPKEGAAFMLVPWQHVHWRGRQGRDRHAKLRVDAQEVLMDGKVTVGGEVLAIPA